MQEKRAGSLADPPRYGRVRERTEKIGRLGLPQGVREGFDFAKTLTDLDAVVTEEVEQSWLDATRRH